MKIIPIELLCEGVKNMQILRVEETAIGKKMS
jgi:hypothetical protein